MADHVCKALYLLVGLLQFRDPLRHAPFKFEVETFKLLSFAVQIGEYAHLGPQDFRYDRDRNIVDRPTLISPQTVKIGQMDRRDENDRNLLEAGMLSNHRGQFEAVEIWHAHIDQDDRDVGLEQVCQRLARRVGRNQDLAEVLEDHLVTEQLRWLVVDQEDVDFVVCHDPPPISDAATSAARPEAVRY